MQDIKNAFAVTIYAEQLDFCVNMLKVKWQGFGLNSINATRSFDI